ncbi:phosphatase PAP2 family protein [bacterium]|nr:phosphatase PAP2 family protein [bacterium]
MDTAEPDRHRRPACSRRARGHRGPAPVEVFACTLGITISPTATPHLNMLLRRTLVDAGLATYKAKIKYNRTRPFVAANDISCYPQDEEKLRKDGSYPSGHSAYGWAWALILAEMVPDKADAIIQRGYQFGLNRVVCGVHWQSDVNAGRVVAAAVVAQLHTNADFKAQFVAAQKEVQAALANHPTPDCALEQEAAAR